MIRIPQQHEDTVPRTTAAQPRRAARVIYKLPIRKLAGRSQVNSGDQSRASLEAVVEDEAIDLRVDWDGSPSSLGRFEVRVGPGLWRPCELIDTDSTNDVISPATAAMGETFRARVERGPEHKACRFETKAMLIVWKEALPWELDPSFVVERGKHYEYEIGQEPENLPWIESEFVDGIQKLTLPLGVGRDYEVWVRVQDPNDSKNWRVQDPIIRTGRPGGEPT